MLSIMIVPRRESGKKEGSKAGLPEEVPEVDVDVFKD